MVYVHCMHTVGYDINITTMNYTALHIKLHYTVYFYYPKKKYYFNSIYIIYAFYQNNCNIAIIYMYNLILLLTKRNQS